MEGNKEENEKEKVGTCPCHTTPKEAAWNEKQWEKHWKDRNQGHKKRIERLHKDSRQ